MYLMYVLTGAPSVRAAAARFAIRRGVPARGTSAVCLRPGERPKEMDVTDQERQKAEDLISRLEISVGQIFPRDGGNASLIATMIQSLNGLRSLLGLVRPH
jgi:hypothetical protein